MPFATFYGINTVVAETNIWIEDGSRLICMTYHYEPNSGHLEYAACIHRRTLSHLDYEGFKHYYDPTIDLMSGCEETTNRRFEMSRILAEELLRMHVRRKKEKWDAAPNRGAKSSKPAAARHARCRHARGDCREKRALPGPGRGPSGASDG